MDKRSWLARILRDHISDTSCRFFDPLILQDNLLSATDTEVSWLIIQAMQHITDRNCRQLDLLKRQIESLENSEQQSQPAHYHTQSLPVRGRYPKPA